MEKITIDFETRSRANLKKIGAYEYSMDPSTIVTCLGFKSNKSPECYLFKFHTMQKPWKEMPEKFKDLWTSWLLNGQVIFSAHNAFFEQVIFMNVLCARQGWPRIPPTKWRCTAAKAAAVAIPRNLDGAGRVMKLIIQKDFEGHRVMMKLCKPTASFARWQKNYDKVVKLGYKERALELLKSKPVEFWTPETAGHDYEILYKYCKIDVQAEEKLDESLPDLTPFEQKLWLLDQKINLRGTQVDMPVVNKISNIMKREAKIMGKELDILTMGLVSSGNARNAILDFLTLEDIELPDLKAKTVDDFLKNGKATGDAKRLLEIRRALSKASTAKYQKFQGCAASDGRVRDLFLYCGASTGRWGGKNVQPQNFPRGIIKDINEAIERIKTCDLEDLKMLYGENLMPLFSSVLRGMFIASPGHELFVEDYNAIETRVLWWLAGHEKGLDHFHNNTDPYWVMARSIFKFSIDLKYDETNPQHFEMRQVGKAAVLGCGYQMGGKKFVSAAWDVYRAKVDLDMAKVAVTAYREMHYPVTELWANYQNAAIFAIEKPGTVYRVGLIKFFVKDSFLWIQLPSGRRLAYKDPSVTMENVEIKNDDGEIVNKFMAKKIRYWAINNKAKKEECPLPGVKWTREATYGGKLAENIVQAVSRDILAVAMDRVERNGFRVLMHSHDELVSEAPIGKYKSEEYRRLMETLPAWADGLPLKTSGWVGHRYKKG